MIQFQRARFDVRDSDPCNQINRRAHRKHPGVMRATQFGARRSVMTQMRFVVAHRERDPED